MFRNLGNLDGPRLAARLNRLGPRPGTEIDNGIQVVDRILEPQTIAHFLESCIYQQLPNGKSYSTSLPSEEEIMWANTPYQDWAPAPYNELSDFLIHKMMTRIGSYADSGRLLPIPQPLFHVKSRLWEGIMPLSEHRWRSLELDEPKHHRMACEQLGSVMIVFEYLHHNRGRLRDTFNLISEHLEEFDNVLNSIRTSRGQEKISMTTSWFEFISAHYQIITARAHAWVHDHAYRILNKLLEDIRNDQTATEGSFSTKQWDLTNRWHDMIEIANLADCTIFMPMTGYTGFVEPAVPPLYSSELSPRVKSYSQRVKELSRVKMFAKLLDHSGNYTHDGSISSPSSIANRCKEQLTAHDDARIEIRGVTQPVPVESWIQQRLKHKAFAADQPDPVLLNCGYIVYRLTNTQTEEEWVTFQQKFATILNQCDDELSGIRHIKDVLHLHWLDGAQFEMGERDIEAAKTHFRKFREQDDFPKICDREIFLVIDQECVLSYLRDFTNPSASSFTGITGGFVLAIDADFDPDAEPDERDEESPGYTGVLQILGDILWTDLFAMMSSQTQYPRELWPAAMEHPDTLYIGPITQWMRNTWAQGN